MMKIEGVLIMIIMGFIIRVVMGEVYKVGDAAGWTNIGHVDYKSWASSKTFHVGDTIVFEYNKDFQNVARVSYENYQTCNDAGAYATYTSGNDSFHVAYPGHYYFICTLPGHCFSGQKVDIRVPAGHPTPPPTSGGGAAPLQPLPFPYPPPSVPSPSPSPSPSQLPPPPPPPSSSPSMSFSGESPSPLPAIVTPEVAPTPHKNGGSQQVNSIKIWITMILLSFNLIAFIF